MLAPTLGEVTLWQDPDSIWTVGYNDFHNLMGFTNEKMPNNILINVCQKLLQVSSIKEDKLQFCTLFYDNFFTSKFFAFFSMVSKSA